MLKFWVKSMLILTIIFALPILIVRAQPYADRVSPALVSQDCAMPCFMDIRPGVTTVDAALYTFNSHEWSTNTSKDFPAQARYTMMYDAVLPRTTMNWRWSAAHPDWINDTQLGSIVVEGLKVIDISFDTDLSVGDIILAFGLPDQFLYFVSNNRRFGYIAWYDGLSMLISAEGFCPSRNIYHMPVRVSFRPESHGFFESSVTASACN